MISSQFSVSLSRMDQLSDSLASMLDLTKGESDLIKADPNHAVNPSANNELSLIGRVVTDRDLSTNYIRANLLRLIRPVKGTSFKLLSANMFVIQFDHPLDRKKAMKGCPWILDKYALIMEPIDPTKKHDDHRLTQLPIMVRVLQLSLANRSEHVAKLIGDSLGTFMELPKPSEDFYSPFFRFQISVDVSKPLKRGVTFQGVDGNTQFYQVMYERLPFFCFLCGVLGHGEEDCPTRYEDGFVEPEHGLPYGQWMRVVDGPRTPLGALNPSQRANPSRSTARNGSDILAYTMRGGDANRGKENGLKHAIRQEPNKGMTPWQLIEGEGSVASSASFSSGGRRRVHVPNFKRKANEVVTDATRLTAKKPQLRLRDEDMTTSAEAAEQSRRDQ